MSSKCQSCGAFHPEEELVKGEVCPTCDGPYFIKNYKAVAAMPLPRVNKCITVIQAQVAENPNSTQLNLALGLCFFKLKQLEKALTFFDKAMIDNFSDPEPYFYASICLLKGKKAFVSVREEIEKIETNLESANSLEPKPIYYYFQAYIKNDYYERKYLNTKVSSKELLETARQSGLTEEDVAEFYELTGVDKPEGM